MRSYFAIKEMPYCLRNEIFLKTPSARSTRYGTNSDLLRACLVSNNLPLSVKPRKKNKKTKLKFKEK